MEKVRSEKFTAFQCAAFAALTVACALLCVCAGSVDIPVRDTLSAIRSALFSTAYTGGTAQSIILSVRLPRVLCAALVGGALSVSGAAMQGLLRNPLADGSTLGVSSGASLGAVIAIAFGVQLPGLPFAGTMGLAMLFAFLSLAAILSLAYRLDSSLSTNTIILTGVVFSMFANSITSLIVTFAGEHVKSIMFWTMGSLSGSNYTDALTLLAGFAVCGGLLLCLSRELNAFSVGEDNARHVGVDVRRVKLAVLIASSALIGICVSVSGTIGFVGLVVPHVARLLTGPNHARLLPASAFAGAIFLMLADLAARVVLRPRELPIGVVTSFIGTIVFIAVFYKAGRSK
ncbi:MAG: iron ABC transporter permease [Oscillospiraceae bacterium]|nr:iron ABC transporter permease [Oscillospiraceae bacterium]